MEATKWLKPLVSVSRIGDSASVQAVTRVNAEQTSKRTMRRPTRRPFRVRLIRLPARSVRAGGMGCAGQDQELGTLRAQILDRSRQEAVAPQRVGDRARQQACPHRLGGAG